MATRTFRVEVIHERDTKRMSFYGGPLGGILGSGIYLHTEQLKQQFGGNVPKTLTINVTGSE